MSSLGLGYAKVIVEITRANGKVDRLTVHRMHLSDMDDTNLEMRPVEDPRLGLDTRMSPSVEQRWEMSLDLEGKLFAQEGTRNEYSNIYKWEMDIDKEDEE